jgi:16S rRNA (uracil1498-N3)-methyltransferase
MHWFYVENSQVNIDEIIITGSDVNHIKNVLRMTTGECIAICDGQGKDYYCTITSVSSTEIIANIEEVSDSKSELPSKIYLFQGLPKKDKMELIIQKAVELGAYEIIPLAMKRSVVKLDDKKKELKKIERWQAIAVSAAKQSGRGIIPRVHSVLDFSQGIEMAKTLEYNVIPYEQSEGILKAHKVIEEAAGYNSIGVFIGPEGGFADKEIQKVMEAGMETITLGRRILRTETAGLAVMSLLMFEIEKRQE